jgi:hypothetical protein
VQDGSRRSTMAAALSEKIAAALVRGLPISR